MNEYKATKSKNALKLAIANFMALYWLYLPTMGEFKVRYVATLLAGVVGNFDFNDDFNGIIAREETVFIHKKAVPAGIDGVINELHRKGLITDDIAVMCETLGYSIHRISVEHYYEVHGNNQAAEAAWEELKKEVESK